MAKPRQGKRTRIVINIEQVIVTPDGTEVTLQTYARSLAGAHRELDRIHKMQFGK